IKKQRAYILKELSEGNIDLALDNTLVGYEEFLYKEIMSDRWCLTGPCDRIPASIDEDSEKKRWAQVGADHLSHDDDKQSSPAILADSYTTVALAMVATGCVAMMPQRVAQHLARFYQIKILPTAVEEQPISCYQFWSNVVSRSLEHEWLRHVI